MPYTFNRVPAQTAKGVYNDTRNLPSHLLPGNLGEISRVIWPFWYTFSVGNEPVKLAPNTAVNAHIVINAEAAFVWMSMVKSAFVQSGTTPNFIYTAIDDNDPDEANKNIHDVNITLRDTTSSRGFMKNPMALDMVGPAKEPTDLPTSQIILPNTTMEVIFQNNSAKTIVTFLTFFGYRVRPADLEKIRSAVTG